MRVEEDVNDELEERNRSEDQKGRFQRNRRRGQLKVDDESNIIEEESN